jgi:6-phosphofructokinase 1
LNKPLKPFEANSVKNGIGLVKLLGFIALKASLASKDVNICLIPETKFNLYGENGLLEFLFKLLEVKSRCVIVVTEGAGFSIADKKIKETGKTNKSGKPVLPDIGNILKDEIKNYSEKKNVEITMKYIDLPSKQL